MRVLILGCWACQLTFTFLTPIFKDESFFVRKVGSMKAEKSKEIFWSIISILVGGGAWLTMQNISWGIVDPAKVGLVFAVIGLISLIWALFDKNSD